MMESTSLRESLLVEMKLESPDTVQICGCKDRLRSVKLPHGNISFPQCVLTNSIGILNAVGAGLLTSRSLAV